MISLDVYKFINELIGSRPNVLEPSEETSQYSAKTFHGSSFNIHVVSSFLECRAILRDPAFRQPDISAAIGAVTRNDPDVSNTLRYFLSSNPIAMKGLPHKQARHQFLSHYNASRNLLEQSINRLASNSFEEFILDPSLGITKGLVEKYVDSAIEKALNLTPGREIPAPATCGPHSSEIFEYIHSPRKLRIKAKQVGDFLNGLPPSTNEAPILLSYILQGRGPMIGAMSGYMHHLVRQKPIDREAELKTINARELFWRTCPVNYIGRVATRSGTIGETRFTAGDQFVLMLPWASHDPGANEKESLAFGGGLHVCAGQALALSIAGGWLQELKISHDRVPWRDIQPDTPAACVFQQYSQTVDR